MQYATCLISLRFTPSKHAREPRFSTAQSLRVGCSRRVHKIEYLAVNKGKILVNVLLAVNNHRELLSLINPAVYLLNKSFVG